MSEDFKVIETQEQLESVLKKRLEREQNKYMEQIKELEERYDGQASELHKQIGELTSALNAAKEEKDAINASISEKDAKLKEYELHSVKTQVAHELGLSFEAVDFLKGSNEEEVRRSAEALKGLVGARTAPLAKAEPDVQTTKEAALMAGLRKMSQELR